MPATFTVAAGSWRYMGEIASKIAVCSRPAANPTTAIPPTRHHGSQGGDVNARYKNAVPATPHAKASVQLNPFFASRGGAAPTAHSRPAISPRKYRPTVK